MKYSDLRNELSAKGITLTVLEKTVRTLARKNPDYIYRIPERPSPAPDVTGESVCYYTELDEDDNLVGSCIFGRALELLGVDLSVAAAYEGVGIDTLLGTTYHADRDAWFGHVQSGQDQGKPWATAVRDADSFIGKAASKW